MGSTARRIAPSAARQSGRPSLEQVASLSANADIRISSGRGQNPLTFVPPALPGDIDLLSRPITYLALRSVRPTANRTMCEVIRTRRQS